MIVCPQCQSPCRASQLACPGCGASLVPSGPLEVGTGSLLGGRYELVAGFGRRRGARLYAAVDQLHRLPVTVGIYQVGRANAEVRGRFLDETRRLTTLHHPHLLQLLDAGELDERTIYLVNEEWAGRPLGDLRRAEGVLAPRRVCELMAQALSALAVVHALSFGHRQLRLDSLLVGDRGGLEHLKVADLGLAAFSSASERELTDSAAIAPAPDYLAPEQIRGEMVSGRADLYAAGAMIYELLTGAPPFHGSAIAVLRRHLHQPPEPPRLRRPDLDLPVALEAVCLRALAKLPEERFSSAAAMREALQRALQPPRVSVPTPQPNRLPPLPFVDRQGELAALTGGGQSAIVVGPAGCGRSRLVEEWRRHHHHQAITLRPDPSGARLPFFPVRRAVAEILGLSDPPSLAELEAATTHRLGDRLGLAEIFALLPSPGPLERPLRRREATAAAAALLVDGDSRRLVVCEDVERYDYRSIEVAQELLGNSRGARVIAVTTDPALLRAEQTIALGPLPYAALVELGVSPYEPAATDGLPLTIEQMVHARAEGLGASDPRSRLAALPEAPQRLFRALLCVGGEASLPQLTERWGGDPEAPLGELERRNLVLRQAGGVLLPSPAFRDLFYATLDEEERRLEHGAWAALLARHGASPLLIAHHAWSADPAQVSVEMAEAAATAAEAADDVQARLVWRQRALTIARGQGDERAALRNALALGEAQFDRRDLDGAATTFGEAALAAAGADQKSQALARRGLGRVHMIRHQDDRAAAELRRAIEAALADGDRSLIGDLSLDLAAVLHRQGRSQEVNTSLAEGMRRSVDDAAVRWRLFMAAAERAHSARHDEQTLRLGERALATAERVEPQSESLAAVARVRRFLAEVSEAVGDEVTATVQRGAAIDALRQLGDRRSVAELHLAIQAGRAEPPSLEALAEAEHLAAEIGWSEGVRRARALRLRLPSTAAP